LNLYRQTKPHAGFDILLKWAQAKPRGFFVFTSNVDGQFQKAGFPEDNIVECHGSIHFLQDGNKIISADPFNVTVNQSTFRAEEPLPRGLDGSVLRPNVLMFNDWGWDSSSTFHFCVIASQYPEGNAQERMIKWIVMTNGFMKFASVQRA